MDGGVLRITRPLDLQGYSGIPARLVKRIELYDDWLLLDVPKYEGIRFIERLEEASR